MPLTFDQFAEWSKHAWRRAVNETLSRQAKREYVVQRGDYIHGFDFGADDCTTQVIGRMLPNGCFEIVDVIQEKPQMKLEDAITITRYGRFGGNRARIKLREEAFEVCRAHAEALLAAAEKKAEAERVLVDVDTYGDCLMSNYDKRWVKRTFSDGSVTKDLEPRQYAEQIKYTFEQGKKAAKL